MYKSPSKEIVQALDAVIEIEDFLPPPAELAKREKKEKITIQLDSACVQFFKDAAEKSGSKYQTLINAVLVKYVEHYSKPKSVRHKPMMISDVHSPKYGV
ncbi:MAG: BrnA antitoxin family protein [Fibrobacter sp.]|nr:BrnA antitoxin family protein [Fibrobacter sp.]